MHLKSVSFSCIAGICLLFTGYVSSGQGTAFLYQGQLGSNGVPANGTYIFTFTLYPAAQTNGTVAVGSVTNSHVVVTDGLFTTSVDFGPGIFTGENLWMQIGLGLQGGTNFTILQDLQPVLPAPYAVFANSASNLVGALPASQLSGTLPASAFAGYTNTVALTNGDNLFAGAFTGNGAAVTNVDVTNLTGVLADSQLPNNTAYLDSNQTFSGANVFTNLYGNSFSGSFFGNGLVGWIVVPSNSINTTIDTGYLLTNSQTPVMVNLPTTAHVGDVVRIACAGASGWELTNAAGQSVIGNFLSYAKTWRQTGASDLNWISMASSSDGTRMLAADYAGTLYQSINSGQAWNGLTVGNLSSAEWTGVASSSDGTILAAVANDNGIFLSTNSGSSWTVATVTPSSSVPWNGIASSANGSNMVASAYTNYLYYSSNGGRNWSQGANTSSLGWTAVASSANGSQMYATYIGGIYTSANYGQTWSGLESGGDFVAIASSANGERLIAAATNSGGGIYISSNGGGTWSQTLSMSGPWTAVASSSDGSKLVAVMKGGAVYTSSDWGASGTWQNNGMTAQWDCVASSSDGSVIAAGIYNATTSGLYGIYTASSDAQTVTTAGASGSLSGSQGSAAELQYIGNNQWMPVSSSGTLWAQ